MALPGQSISAPRFIMPKRLLY